MDAFRYICNSTAVGKMACAIVFFLFTLLWLSVHLGDVIWWFCQSSAVVVFLIALLLSVAVVGLVLLLQRLLRHTRVATHHVFSNLMMMAGLMILLGTVADIDDVAHYKLRMRRYMQNGDYAKALLVGRRSRVTDGELFRLRFRSLAETGGVGEHLFEYPVAAASDLLSKDDDEKTFLVYLLLEKDLEAFAGRVAKVYRLRPDTLPKHLREALVLYQHRSQAQRISYADPATAADYEDYLKLKKQAESGQTAASSVRDVYGNTYWYYFDWLPSAVPQG